MSRKFYAFIFLNIIFNIIKTGIYILIKVCCINKNDFKNNYLYYITVMSIYKPTGFVVDITDILNENTQLKLKITKLESDIDDYKKLMRNDQEYKEHINKL
jgi:hypothetical protein